MAKERVGHHVSGGREPDEEREARERRESLREALSYWPAGVAILAVRDGGRVHALTVSSFIPVSIEPPLVLVSLGPNASALPYLEPGVRYVISVLGDDQKGYASRYADTFPVGPDPFPGEGDPRVAGSIASLTCVVDEMIARGDHTLVIGRVRSAAVEDADSALAYFRRGYHRVGPETELD